MKGVRDVRPILEGREPLQVKVLRRTPAPSCRELGPELERLHDVASKTVSTHTHRGNRPGQENVSKCVRYEKKKKTSCDEDRAYHRNPSLQAVSICDTYMC